MKKPTFWDQLLGGEYATWDKIDEAAAEIITGIADKGRSLPQLGIPPAGVSPGLAHVIEILGEVGFHVEIDIFAG